MDLGSDHQRFYINIKEKQLGVMHIMMEVHNTHEVVLLSDDDGKKTTKEKEEKKKTTRIWPSF